MCFNLYLWAAEKYLVAAVWFWFFKCKYNKKASTYLLLGIWYAGRVWLKKKYPSINHVEKWEKYERRGQFSKREIYTKIILKCPLFTIYFSFSTKMLQTQQNSEGKIDYTPIVSREKAWKNSMNDIILILEQNWNWLIFISMILFLQGRYDSNWKLSTYSFVD